MPIEFLLGATPGVYIFKGNYEELPDPSTSTDLVEGDIYEVAGVRYLFKNNKFEPMPSADDLSGIQDSIDGLADEVSELPTGTDLADNLQNAKEYTDTAIDEAISELPTPTFKETDPLALPKINSHMSTDRFRWQDTYDEQRKTLIMGAKVDGLMPNEDATVVTPAQTGNLTVNDEFGGIMGVTFQNTDSAFSIITINGIEEYSSDGLTAGVSVTKYFWLKNGDTISATNAETFTYTPFVNDPTSTVYLMKQQLAHLADQTTSNYALIVKVAQDVYNGTTPQIDTSQGTTVFGNGGLLTLGGGGSFTVPENGAIVVSYTAVLGIAPTLTVNDVAVDYGGVSFLGNGEPTEIRVNGGDVVTASGSLGLGSSFNVTFYPNKAL